MQDPANDEIRSLLQELVDSGEEVGVQAAAFLNNQLVIDAWAGSSNEIDGTPVTGQTLFTAFAMSKAVTSVCVHKLVERFGLSYDTPVADVWPEFRHAGKSSITLAHVLTHTSGIPQTPDLSSDDLGDWEVVCKKVAHLEPLWPAGSQIAYHAYTFGWVLGEVIRRVSGRTISDFLRDEITRPLGLDGMFIGLPDSESYRVAKLKDRPSPEPKPRRMPHELLDQAMPPHLRPTAELFNQPAIRAAVIPAANGLMNARSLAKFYAMLAAGGSLGGAEILSAVTVQKAVACSVEGEDAVLSRHARLGMGFMLGDAASPMRHEAAFGHTGAGGSIGFADPTCGFAFAYTKNLINPPRAGGDSPSRRVADRVRELLRINFDSQV